MSNSDSPFCFYPDAQRQVLENIKMLGQSPESGITFSPEQSVGCRMFALGDPVTGPHNKRHVLDMTGHVASMLFGYNHVALTGEAVERELALAAKTRFASGDFGTPFRGLLGPVFRRVVMQDVFTHSIFFTEGARAVECACKIAHYCRQSETSTELDKVGKWLTPDIGFHGRSVLALSLTTSYDVRKHKNMPYMDCVEKVSCPTILENENIEDLRAREDEALYEIQQKIKELGDRFIGFILEPMVGEGGYKFYTPRFLQELDAMVHYNGGVFVIDEIQTAFSGGRIFLHQVYDIDPDLVVFGKKFGMSGVLTAQGFTKRFPSHPLADPQSRVSSTWSGDPVADVRLRLMLEYLEERGYLQKVQPLGKRLRTGLQQVIDTLAAPGQLFHVRGVGLLSALDAIDSMLRSRLLAACLERDLLLLPCGLRSIRFCPPITISEDEIDLCISRFEQAALSVVKTA